jgi:hypothetical protein
LFTIFFTIYSYFSATKWTRNDGDSPPTKTNATLSLFVRRRKDWNIQNAQRIRDCETWKTLVKIAADALICATGGFARESTAAALPCPVQKLPVFTVPFATLKKSPSSVPSLTVAVDAKNLSDFVYNAACQCK